jgi:hypothetical protein
MIKKLSSAIIEHRYIVFGIILIVTVIFGFQIRHLIIRTQLEDLFPADHAFIKVHEKYKDQLGSPFKVFLMIKVKDGDIYNRKTLEKIRRITDRLDAIPGVNHNHIYSIGSQKLKRLRIDRDMILTEPVMPDIPSSMDEFKEIIQASSGIFGVWTSRDNRSAIFSSEFIQRDMEYDVIFKQLQKIKYDESDDNHIIYMAGEPVLMGWVNEYQSEMWWIFGLTFLSLFGLLYIYFRNIPGIIAPVLSTVVGGIWGLGFCGLVGYNLEPLILVIPLLITARALSHAVQITERYFECYHKVGNVKEACILCMTSILPPGTLGIVTDALGIFFIAVAPVPIIQKLAYLCSFWAISIIVSGLIFTPLVLSFIPPAKNISKIIESRKGLVFSILTAMGRMCSGRGPGIILMVVIILAGVSGVIASKVKIGDIHPGSPILWEDADYNISVGQINESFPGTEELYVLVEGKEPRAVMNPGFLKVLDTFQRYMEKSPLVGRSLSVADLVPTIHRSIYAGHPKFETLPVEETQSAQMFNQIEAHSAPGDYDLYFSRDGSVANVIIWYKDHKGETLRSAVSRVKKFMEDYKELLKEEHCSFQLASGNLGILAAINDIVAIVSG